MSMIDINLKLENVPPETISAIYDELIEMLSKYLYQPNVFDVRRMMRNEIMTYFTEVWQEITLHRVVVDSLSASSGIVFVAVDGECVDPFEELINYEVDFFVDCNDIDEAIDTIWEGIVSPEVILTQSDDTWKEMERAPESPDDILYAPVKPT